MTYSKTKPNQLKYLSSYPLEVQNKIRTMVEQDTLYAFYLKSTLKLTISTMIKCFVNML